MTAEVIEKGILLTFDEIRILLYGMGVSEIDGVYMPEKAFTEEEFLLAMQHLSASGLIEAGDEKFLIREDIRSLLEIVSSPEWTDIWKPLGEEGPAYFLYFSESRIVVSERFWRKKDTLRLTVFEREEFDRWREEYINDYCGD